MKGGGLNLYRWYILIKAVFVIIIEVFINYLLAGQSQTYIKRY